ncbi:MAG: DUF3618 domain-containing protein [Actinobacteria bacterium]|nr:DUF3618 domain-containing protein [Actinomycetota bacterium]MCA1719653.1 DUF3618 domain-containing protein [Actinomycetota bacterium]
MAGTDETAAKGGRAKKAAPDTEAMAADIEKTREELAETLDAIADKVSPKRVAKRTTKKVGNAVKETASDAAQAVKEGAGAAKDKVSRSEQSWAPGKPKPVEVAPPEGDATHPLPLPSAAPVELSEIAPAASYPSLSTSTTTPPASLVKPEYVVAGAFAALIAWLLVRRR